MLLAEVVRAWTDVAATRSRKAKVATLAETLRRMDTDEVAVGAGYLAGTPRQERTGVGWRTVAAVDVTPAAEPSLALLDVDAAFDRLAAVSGTGSTTARREELARLFGGATEPEQRFLRGLLVGELRQGALEGIVAQAVAAAFELDEALVRRAVMLRGNLAAVAAAARDGGAEALRGFRLQLFRPLAPMLAQTAAGVAEALGDGPAAAEYKLDGARVQVHRDGDRLAVYTRNLRDVSARMPEVAKVARGFDANRLVLDGEVLSLRGDGRPRPFQEMMGRFGTQQGAATPLPLAPFFFDALHVDGADLLDAALSERWEALAAVVPAAHRVTHAVVDDVTAAEALLADALRAGHEGLVVKDLEAPYAAGRRGAAWRKVKVAHTLDLVVLAVEWGSGRRKGWLSNLHLGARDPDSGGFVMLGKTFKGMTDEMLAWQTEHLQALSTDSDGHVVHVRPELVVEVAFDGVQASSRYPGGVALRFARVKGYRPDKSPKEVDTIDVVRALYDAAAG